MYKKAFIVFPLVGLVLLSMLAMGVQTAGAAAPLSAPHIQIGQNQASVTFAELGYREQQLISPYDSTRVMFSIPPNWTLMPGGEVELTYDLLLSGADASKVTGTGNPYGGALTVSFNDVAIGSLPLTEVGTHTVRLAIPATALTSSREDGRHQLEIALAAQFSCIYDIRAIVTIKDTSLFDLLFEVTSPQLDLSHLPAPFYLHTALVPDSTRVVVPDSPSDSEMQAAMDVMAGLGSMIGQTYDVSLVPNGQLTDEARSQSNLIFVGKPDNLPLLSDVQFPVPVVSGKFSGLPTESAKDGVLELGMSPWNGDKVVMLVSGVDDAAVIKAAQAVSSGKIFVFQNRALSYISDVQLLAQSIPVVEDFTLEALGYTTETLSGFGLNNTEYQFYVSKEQVTTQDGYIDLVYYHSGLLNYGVSSLTVSLNGQIVGSAPYDKTSEQLSTLRIKVPPGVLRFGENRMTVSTNLLAETTCDTTGFSDPWLVISDQTAFHLPAGEPPLGTQKQLDLRFFPTLFITQSDLGDLAFVLPRNNAPSWKVAGQMAYILGWEANPLVADLKVAFADNVSDALRQNSSLLLVGKASDLPVLSDFNDRLPAPFDLATNTATERDMQIVYRIPPGVSVGYLELAYSPYNLQKMVFITSGNDDNGLAMSGSALASGAMRSRLAGRFAVTDGVQLATSSSSSQFSIVGTLVPGQEPIVATPIPANAVFQPGFNRPPWLNLLPLVSAAIIVVILIYVIAVTMMRNREPRSSEPRRKNGK